MNHAGHLPHESLNPARAAYLPVETAPFVRTAFVDFYCKIR
jgi:hypothetical protein